MIGLLTAVALAAKTVPAPPPPPEPPPVPVDPLAWRAQAPPPGAPLSWTPPAPVTFTLSNGIPVELVERDELPVVTVSVVILAGRESTPVGKAGLPSFTADLLDEGTALHDGLALSDRADELGAELSTGFDGDASYAQVSTLVETVDASLDLLREVVRQPLFDKKDAKRIKLQTIDDVASIADDPGQTARAVWRDEFFGTASPFGALELGTPASVRHFTSKDAQGYWSTWWVPGAARILVSGALDADHAKKLLEARFADWTGPKPPAAMPPTAKNPDATRIVFVEKPGAVQSVLRVGQLGPLRSDPDWWSVETMNAMLGGMFSSRINLNLREAHGWSYGAFSFFASSRLFGTFTASTSVQADATARAVAEVVKEIRGIREAPASADELATGKDALRLSLAGQFETNGQITGTLADLAAAGLPIDWLAGMPGGVGKVTAEDAQAAAKGHLDPDHLLIVVVGPKTAKGDDGVAHDTVAELGQLGLGPVEVRGLWADEAE